MVKKFHNDILISSIICLVTGNNYENQNLTVIIKSKIKDSLPKSIRFCLVHGHCKTYKGIHKRVCEGVHPKV